MNELSLVSHSFLISGKTAAFVGASTAGRRNTVLVDPSSRISSVNEFEKVAKNIRSSPIEVSSTYGM